MGRKECSSLQNNTRLTGPHGIDWQIYLLLGFYGGIMMGIQDFVMHPTEVGNMHPAVQLPMMGFFQTR